MTETIFDKKFSAAYKDTTAYRKDLEDKKIKLADYSAGIFIAFENEDKEKPCVAMWGDAKKILMAQEYLSRAVVEKLSEAYEAYFQSQKQSIRQ